MRDVGSRLRRSLESRPAAAWAVGLSGAAERPRPCGRSSSPQRTLSRDSYEGAKRRALLLHQPLPERRQPPHFNRGCALVHFRMRDEAAEHGVDFGLSAQVVRQQHGLDRRNDVVLRRRAAGTRARRAAWRVRGRGTRVRCASFTDSTAGSRIGPSLSTARLFTCAISVRAGSGSVSSSSRARVNSISARGLSTMSSDEALRNVRMPWRSGST